MHERVIDLVDLARVRDLVHSGAARSIRLAGHLSQQQVADHCGVTNATVCRWESTGSNRRMPTGEPAVRYLELLERLMQR
jgi:DNA-binding transcriptional regulator YiaG